MNGKEGKVNSTLEYLVNKFNLDLSLPSPIVINYSRFSLVNDLKELNFITGVEIGTEHAFYAQKLCKANPELNLTCVDPYVVIPYYEGYKDQEQVNEHYLVAQERLKNYKHEILRMTSMEAVKKFNPNSVDFVFIDGNHYFEYVVNDIIYWSRIVKPNGIVFGHDYSDQFDVKQAVNAFVDVHKINPWFILHKKGLVDSWLYVKGTEHAYV